MTYQKVQEKMESRLSGGGGGEDKQKKSKKVVLCSNFHIYIHTTGSSSYIMTVPALGVYFPTDRTTMWSSMADQLNRGT